METTDTISVSKSSESAVSGTLLDVQGLKTYFHTHEGVSRAVDGVSFSLQRRETLGVVGESGCGKSVTALSIMGLVPSPPGRIVDGSIVFDGEELTLKSNRDMRHIRGNRISMIFQEPSVALNPVFTVGNQLIEVFRIHEKLSRRDAHAESVRLLEQVRIPSAKARMNSYPHELSGGMCQRIMIAMALACRPELLIADEPTTALDVTVQAKILSLMNELKDEIGASVMLITHDLGVVAEMAENVVVMYAGEVVDYSPVGALFAEPLHPYTECLLKALPRPDQLKDRLDSIPGTVPSPLHFPTGCRFHPRCPKAFEECSKVHPPLYTMPDGRLVRCLLYR